MAPEQLGLDTAAAFVPDRPTLPKLRAAAADCTACHLYKLGTQTVFGEGSADADVVFVGEQPGDQEDLAGRPFVGPAGRVLDEGLAAAGIDRSQVYVTNAVKHFKWEPRGKRRIHQKPNSAEMTACRPWLEAELAVVKPDVLVCLGATAAQSLLGRQFRVTKMRGVPVESELAPNVVATVHPSSILRAPDEGARQEAMRDFVRDLKAVAKLIKSR
jgi:uracil-DNA glycosylase family protein